MSIMKNMAAMMTGQVITFVLAFVLKVIIANHLGDEGYGKLTIAISLTTILSLFVGLGIGSYLTKEVARDRSQAGVLFVNAAVMRFGFSVIVFGAMLITFSLLNQKPDTKELSVLIGIYMLLSAFTGLVGTIFQGYEKMFYVTLGLVPEKLVLTVVSVILLLKGYSVVAIGWVYLLAGAVNFLITVIILVRTTRLSFKLDFGLWRRLLKGGLPFYIWAIFGTIYQRIDAIMLGQMTSEAEVGWYGVAFGLYETLAFLPAMLSTVLFPILSRLSITSRASFNQTCRQVLDLFGLITMPISLGTFVLAPQIIALLFGLEHFANSIILLRILALGQLLLFYNILFGTMLLALDKQRQWSIAAVAAAFVNPALNLFLIPFFQTHFSNGGIGAALATEAIELLLMIVAFFLLPRGVFTNANLSTFCRTLGAALVMVGVVWLFRGANIVALVALGAFVYLCLCLVIGVIRQSDITLLFSLINKRGAISERGHVA